MVSPDLTCVHICDYSEGFCFCRFIILNSHTPLLVFPFQSPAHTPSVSPVRQASHNPSITSHVKPSGFTHSSVSPVQQASSITPPDKPSSFTCLEFGKHLQSPLLLSDQVLLVHQCLLFGKHITVLQSPLLLNHQLLLMHQYLQFGPHLTVLQPLLLLEIPPISTSNPDSPTLILPPSQILPKSSVSNEQSFLPMCPAQTSNSHQDDIPSPAKPPLAKRTTSVIRLIL